MRNNTSCTGVGSNHKVGTSVNNYNISCYLLLPCDFCYKNITIDAADTVYPRATGNLTTSQIPKRPFVFDKQSDADKLCESDRQIWTRSSKSEQKHPTPKCLR